IGNASHTLSATGTTAAGGTATASNTISVNNPAGSYTGPGNLGVTWRAWYGLRAYTSASRGNPLVRVCTNNGANCADMVSDSSGNLAAQTIGGVTCPNTLGTCKIATWYNQGSLGSGSGTFDQTQPTDSLRASLMAKALPIVGNTRACAWFPDSGANYTSTAT